MNACSILVAAAVAVLAPGATAQNRAHAELHVRADGDDVKVAVQITLDAGYDIGHGPTKDDVGGPGAPGLPTILTMVGAGFEWSAPRFPEPEREAVDYLTPKTWLNVHFGSPVIYVRGRKTTASADVAALEVKLTGQTCDPTGCFPYGETVKSSGPGPDKLFKEFPADLVVAASTAAVAAPIADGAAGAEIAEDWSERGAGDVARLPLLAFLASAVGWGIFSLLMPCTYPMIPITISYFTKQSSLRQTSLLPLALTYGAGIVLIYVVIGVAVGPLIVPFAANPWFNLAVGLAFVVFALSLFGAILFQPPQFMMGWVGKATKQGGLLGVFLLGALLVVTSFTCTAPFVGSLLATGAEGGRLDRVVLGMGTFGLTMAVPFVFLSLVPGKVKALPRSGEWMHVLKVTLGFVELAAALKFLSNAEYVWQLNALPRELFLMLWGGILLLAALYLFGFIRLKDDAPADGGTAGAIGSGRLLAGLSFALFGLYSFHGALGNRLDWVMTALAPPYSTRIDYAAKPQVVKDDLEAAIARAAAEDKLVLINFTGFS